MNIIFNSSAAVTVDVDCQLVMIYNHLGGKLLVLFVKESSRLAYMRPDDSPEYGDIFPWTRVLD